MTDTAKLTDEQKADIVMRLAAYDSPRAIAKNLKEDFGIEVAPQSLEMYDPTKHAGGACPEKWAALFHETRAKIHDGRADIGLAHKMVRVRWLDQMARRQMEAGNSAEVRALLKQAADEMSESAKQKHEHGGASPDSDLSDAELDARIAAAAARLGLGPVEPGGARTPAGREGATGEPQPPGEPLSG